MTKIAIVIVVWIGCGLPGVAGWNAWTQRHFDLGCGSAARKENLARAFPFAAGGPIATAVLFFETGFFDEGLSFSYCPEKDATGRSRFCQCDRS